MLCIYISRYNWTYENFWNMYYELDKFSLCYVITIMFMNPLWLCPFILFMPIMKFMTCLLSFTNHYELLWSFIYYEAHHILFMQLFNYVFIVFSLYSSRFRSGRSYVRLAEVVAFKFEFRAPIYSSLRYRLILIWQHCFRWWQKGHPAKKWQCQCQFWARAFSRALWLMLCN